MKRQSFVVIVTSIFILFSLLTIVQGYSENEITVKATVYDVGWNAKGELTDVSLLTTDGDELYVVHNPLGDELLKILEQNVKATGAVLIDKQGRKSITIYKYEILYN
jgi:hypothetical protein